MNEKIVLSTPTMHGDEMKFVQEAFDEAIKISRSKTALVEEFVEGEEVSVDVYVEDGVANVLTMSNIAKIKGNKKGL